MGLFQRRQEPERQDEIVEGVQAALAAWKDAQNFFENVSDPDLIDYAIFDMETARRRYMYMLKCARIEQEEIEQMQDEYYEQQYSDVY